MQRLLLASLAAALALCMAGDATAAQKSLNVIQVWQHKDTNMICLLAHPAGLPANAAHAWNCATANKDRHCSTYCAPAACAMYAQQQGRLAPFTNQDNIYDNGKIGQGELPANGTIETHGLGMYVGVGGFPAEVQTAFAYAVGMQPFQHGPQNSGKSPITAQIVKWYIDNNQPILWIDMGHFPADQDSIPTDLILNSGHCRIISGYNDNNTPLVFGDDTYLINDPWPTSGSPYWLAQNLVVDPADIFLAAMQPIGNDPETWGAIKNLYRD